MSIAAREQCHPLLAAMPRTSPLPNPNLHRRDVSIIVPRLHIQLCIISANRSAASQERRRRKRSNPQACVPTGCPHRREQAANPHRFGRLHPLVHKEPSDPSRAFSSSNAGTTTHSHAARPSKGLRRHATPKGRVRSVHRERRDGGARRAGCRRWLALVGRVPRRGRDLNRHRKRRFDCTAACNGASIAAWLVGDGANVREAARAADVAGAAGGACHA